MSSSSARWDQRFLGTTRGQVILLLRRARRTVDELAAALGLTGNAVRSHLATLERDGLVTPNGVRRGDGKPAQLYVLTHDAEQLFPKSYGRLLSELLTELDQQLGADELEALLRQVGRRMAAGVPQMGRTRLERVRAAAEVLNVLGGLAEIEDESTGSVAISGFACPLAEALPQHPAICRLAETLLGEVSGLAVTEHCERGTEPLRCRFVFHV